MFIRKTPRKIRFLILWILFILPFLIYSMYVGSTYEIAEISDLSVGYTRNNDRQMTFSEKIPVGVNRLFACGKITTRGSNYLVMTLFSIDEKNYYGKDDSNKPFPKGNFCNEIMLNSPLSAGTYKIIITDNRKRVGELTFQVE